MKLPRVPVTAPYDEILTALKSNGCVIVEDVLPTLLVDTLRAELRPTLDEKSPGPNVPGEENEVFWGRNTIRFAGLAQLSDAFVEIMINATIHEIAQDFMHGVCNDYWMNTAQFIGIGPGEPAQALHRDNDLWQRVVELTWPNTPELSFNTIIPLHDITEAMGATRIVPGSNRWPDLSRVPTPSESAAAEMSPGSVLIYSGHTLHGGGANTTTDTWRHAVQMSFTAGWLTPEEAHPFAVTMERALSLPRQAQRLLGFRSYLPGGEGGYDRLWLKDYEDILTAP